MALSTPLWANREAAGYELAALLTAWADRGRSTSVIGLPRGGVAVAAAVAERLHLPLGSWAVRKLASAAAPEYALGALAAGGVVVWNPTALASGQLSPVVQHQLIEAAAPEVTRRQQCFGQGDGQSLRGRQLLVVDDGIATGMTVRAALQALRRCQPAELVLAVPVLDRELVADLRPLVDALISVVAVENLRAVGNFYADFNQLSDNDVTALLQQARQREQKRVQDSDPQRPAKR